MTDEIQDELQDELPEEMDAEDLDDLGADDLDGEVETDDDSESDGDGEEQAEALDELEAEELEMLTDDESDETIVVDEAAEMRAIRRAELSLEGDSADEAAADEFVCTSCFLVKRKAQLANKRRKVCLDCAG